MQNRFFLYIVSWKPSVCLSLLTSPYLFTPFPTVTVGTFKQLLAGHQRIFDTF